MHNVSIYSSRSWLSLNVGINNSCRPKNDFQILIIVLLFNYRLISYLSNVQFFLIGTLQSPVKISPAVIFKVVFNIKPISKISKTNKK